MDFPSLVRGKPHMDAGLVLEGPRHRNADHVAFGMLETVTLDVGVLKIDGDHSIPYSTRRRYEVGLAAVIGANVAPCLIIDDAGFLGLIAGHSVQYAQVPELRE